VALKTNNMKYRGLIILVILALFAGLIATVAILVTNNQKGKRVHQNFSTNRYDSSISIKSVTGQLERGLWEIKTDSNTYMLYVGGSGVAITKK